MSAFAPNFGMMVFIRALLGFGGAGGGQGCVVGMNTSLCVRSLFSFFQSNLLC